MSFSADLCDSNLFNLYRKIIMANLSQFLKRSIVGAVITTAALASTGCSTMCHSGRGCGTSKSQSKCGAKCGSNSGTKSSGGDVNYYRTHSPK